jgi:hypothetical protein
MCVTHTSREKSVRKKKFGYRSAHSGLIRREHHACKTSITRGMYGTLIVAPVYEKKLCKKIIDLRRFTEVKQINYNSS